MKKFLLIAFLILAIAPSAMAQTCEVGDQTALKNAAKSPDTCTEVIITTDILVSETPVTVLGSARTFHGQTGSEKVYGDLSGKSVFVLNADNIEMSDMMIENQSADANSYGIAIVTANSGHKIHDVEFQNCAHGCINFAGTSTGDAYQNTFMNTVANKAIVHSGDYPAPTFNSATMSSYTGWQVSLTTPGGATGDVEFYMDDGSGDIVPMGSVLQDKSGTFDTSINFADQLPDATFYALFTGPDVSDTKTTTSDFGDATDTFGVFVDWVAGTNFSFGDFTACDIAWFTDATKGQSGGDFDGDTITNGNEDADNDCTVDSDETDPANADTDGDGVNDNTDNCPLTANADQGDDDSDGTGDACDSDYVDNVAPTLPELVYPEDGATGVEFSFDFLWNASTDSDGDDVTYQLTICENESFEGCDTVDVTAAVAALKPFDKNNFAHGNASMLLLLGAVAFGGAIRKRRKLMLLVISIAMVGLFAASCDGGGSAAVDGGETDPTGDFSYSISDLNPNTTYFWKVTVSDGTTTVDSATRSFTTGSVATTTDASEAPSGQTPIIGS